MCILFIYSNPKPKLGAYRLIIASNRDEFYRRPAEALKSSNDVFGGRDMEAGRKSGMWLGISLKHNENFKLRFGALLNVTGEERKSGVQGRGFIVADYLENEQTANAYNETLMKDIKTYNAFNFIAIELSTQNTSKISHLSNAPVSLKEYEQEQILGFGNSTVEAPLQKVVNGKHKFGHIIEEFNKICAKDLLVEQLFALLKSEEKNLPDTELKRRAPQSYEYLSSIYVKIIDAGYGTRTHSIILVSDDWNVEFIESTMQEPIDALNPEWMNTSLNSKL